MLQTWSKSHNIKHDPWTFGSRDQSALLFFAGKVMEAWPSSLPEEWNWYWKVRNKIMNPTTNQILQEVGMTHWHALGLGYGTTILSALIKHYVVKHICIKHYVYKAVCSILSLT